MDNWRFSRINLPQDVLTIPSQRDPLIDFSAWTTSRFLICRRYDFKSRHMGKQSAQLFDITSDNSCPHLLAVSAIVNH